MASSKPIKAVSGKLRDLSTGATSLHKKVESAICFPSTEHVSRRQLKDGDESGRHRQRQPTSWLNVWVTIDQDQSRQPAVGCMV